MTKTLHILMADDDDEDILLTKEAFAENKLSIRLTHVSDGQELIDLLKRRNKYSEHNDQLPELIFLDLNMPRKDGRETLKEIKSDPLLKQIPIIIYTTSKAEEDINTCYDLGANCYVTKPLTFDELSQLMGTLGRFWMDHVKLLPLPPFSIEGSKA